LCTPHYFSSQYCGKEVGVFLLRREVFRALPDNEQRKAGVVFPIVWEWPIGGLHSTLKRFRNSWRTRPQSTAAILSPKFPCHFRVTSLGVVALRDVTKASTCTENKRNVTGHKLAKQTDV